MAGHNRLGPPDQSTPDSNTQVSGEGGNVHAHLQWLITSVTELKNDTRRLDERMDSVYGHIADAKNESSVACALGRIEASIKSNDDKLSILTQSQTATDTKLLNLAVNQGIQTTKLDQLPSIEGKLDKLPSIEDKLGKLVDIEQKLTKLDEIDTTLRATKMTLAACGAAFAVVGGVAWYVFGDYLNKILSAVNDLVLK
ncbi:hypothetical protein [Serratia plymuthica]|uniref:hypothetical protein n=1 Tax=Serratia plymuthica TaxID=82996 RepID=UPI0004563AAB|nr:hypothetical protein [Serratia plymuthica]AHY09896.1 hypothetical protein sch_09170 [Serratia plymuthica]